MTTDEYQGYTEAAAEHVLSEKRICWVGNSLGVTLMNKKWQSLPGMEGREPVK